MKQEAAKRLILEEWRSLPREERNTERQAAEFAMRIKDQYPFRCHGDRYQVIKGWVQDSLNTWPD
jgi:hypothetical protein